MLKTKKSIVYLTLGIIVFILITNFSLGIYLSNRSQTSNGVNSKPVVTNPEQSTNTKDTFSYIGVEGKNALEVLQSKTKVEQNSSGLVVSINGRKANDKKKEFWAFYVNGKMAQVGPAEYKTKDGEKIEWKMEHY